MIKIATIIGARPQFIKTSILSKLFKSKKDFKEIIIHTGQHYDFRMSGIFFKELKIPKPNYNLGIKNSSHAGMLGKMLVEIEKLLLKIKPDFTIVHGDTNSTLAGALASKKIHIPVIHIESGLRSHNQKMPEEINRVLTDHCSKYFFVPSNLAKKNLIKENIKKNIFKVGDTMLDVYLTYKKKIRKISKKIKNKEPFFFVTIHREENTNNIKILKNIFLNLSNLSKHIKIIFPIHPRTKKIIKNFKLIKKIKNISFIEPLGYLNTIALLKNANLLITDSGGMQKEAFYCNIPCLTVREDTEWPETIKLGLNKLVPPKKDYIYQNAVKYLNLIRNKKKISNVYGFGNASTQILKKIKLFKK